MKARIFKVYAQWDAEAKVWYVAKSDVPGLAIEASTPNKLLSRLKKIVPELIELNAGLIDEGSEPQVPLDVMFQRKDRLKLAV